MGDNFTWRALVIDDEADVADVAAIALADAGFKVETALNGKQGLEQATRFRPHIILTDIRMPGLSGLEVLAQVKKQWPETEVIVVTGHADIDSAIEALKLDASDFITKPISVNALMVATERAQERFQNRKKLRDYTRFLENGWTRTTRELLETNRYQQNLIESSMDGILGCNAEEIVVTFNASLSRLLGYKRHQVINRMKLSDFFRPEEEKKLRHDLAGQEFGGTNRLFMYETWMLDRSGIKVPVQLSMTRIKEELQPQGLVCFIRDLRMIHRLQQEMADQARLLHQDKMMSLGRLAASVAHEINNPLSAVLNYVRLMLKILQRQEPENEQTQKFKRYLEIVEKETARCAETVSGLLTFSRKSDIRQENIDVVQMLEHCLLLSRHRLELSQIELTVDFSPHLPPVWADANQLQQCIINLVFNAIDAMQEGGKITLQAAADATGQWVVITIADTGCGIEPEHLERIFEPFFTTKGEGQGLGLGLATTYGIIANHGGSIDVHSQVGKGTTFIIKLPASRKV